MNVTEADANGVRSTCDHDAGTAGETYANRKDEARRRIDPPHRTGASRWSVRGPLLVALDYATRAAVIGYKDLGAWERALVDGTASALAKKFTDGESTMEETLLALQWSSTPET